MQAGRDPAPQPDPADQDTFQRLLERLRRENEGLRSAMRYRAVIEQAKGILMARSGSDPDTAFRHLVAHSQRVNLKLTQVAAAVVARTVSSPPLGSGTPPTDEQLLGAATGDVALRYLTAAAVASAPDLDELLRTVVQHTQRFGVVGGTLALAEPDGALRLAGVHGVDMPALSAWKRLPPGTDLPLCAVAVSRSPLWLEDAATRRTRFPGSERFPGHREAAAVLPLSVDRQLVGVLGLDWEAAFAFPETVRRELVAVAALCAAPIADLLRRYDEPLPGVDVEPGYAGWFQEILDHLPTPIAIVEPQVDGGTIVDLRVLFSNPAAREVFGTETFGTSLYRLRPDLVGGAFTSHAQRVLGMEPATRSTGEALDPDVARDPVEISAAGLAHLDLSRVGSLLLMSWDHSSSSTKDAARPSNADPLVR